LGGGPYFVSPPTARSLLGPALATAAAVLCLGAVWELVEWVVDGAFGTDFSQGYDDTRDDLRNDAIAALGGGALVAAWMRGHGRR
jgi:hypothetical protein